MTDKWQQVKELFAEAIGQEPAGRRSFIDLHCPNNFVKQEVESLIDAYESADQFLDSPAIGEVADSLVGDLRELTPGDKFRHFRIIRKIGKGGMGDVYLAEDSKLDRRVAIKLLATQFENSDAGLKRFFQEAKAASALNHPNIIVVYELGESDGDHYLAIEYVKGNTLSKAIRDRSYSLKQIVEIATQIMNGLAAAHSAGIVHRDIKPENIMVRDDGIVKILDFGLAKLNENNQANIDFEGKTRELFNTKAGLILGTASYMSPEQARGKSVDGRSDIWSFGVVLYEILTGRLPFLGDTTSDIIASILLKDPAKIEDEASDIPTELCSIVRKSLQKNVNMRYQTAGEVLSDLRRFRRGFEIGEDFEEVFSDSNEQGRIDLHTDGRVTPDTSNIWKSEPIKFSNYFSAAVSQIQSRPKVFSVAAAAVGLFLAIGYLGYLKINRPNISAASFSTMDIRKVTYEGRAQNWAAVSPDGKYIAYIVKDKGKESLALRQVESSGAVEIVPPGDVEFASVVFTPDGNDIYYTVDLDSGRYSLFQIPVLGGSPRKLIDGVDQSVSFSNDGRKIAFVRDDNTILTADPNGNSQTFVHKTDENERYSFVAWNADGSSIFASRSSKSTLDSTIIEISVATGEIKWRSGSSWRQIVGLSTLADGSGIVISGRDFQSERLQIWLLPYPFGEPIRITNDLSTYLGASLTADNKSIVTVKLDSVSNIWKKDGVESKTASQVTYNDGRGEGTVGIASSPDNSIFYTVRTADVFDIWGINEDGSDLRQLTKDQGTNANHVVTPDGRYIVFESDRSGNYDLWRMDIDGGNQIPLANTSDLEGFPSVSPDGKWIYFDKASSNDLATIWKVGIDGGAPMQLTNMETSHPIVSPDGKVFACYYGLNKSGSTMKMAVFPIEGGNPVRFIDSPQLIKARNQRWSEDSNSLIYLEERNYVSNLWKQPINGEPPEQLTFFEFGDIYRFDVVKGSSGFVMSKGKTSSDVVIISNFR